MLLGIFLGKFTGMAGAAGLLLFAVLSRLGQDDGSADMSPTRICIDLTGPVRTIGTRFSDPVILPFGMGSFLPVLFPFTSYD